MNKAVIAVPAKFSPEQRAATGEAFKAAGLKVKNVPRLFYYAIKCYVLFLLILSFLLIFSLHFSTFLISIFIPFHFVSFILFYSTPYSTLFFSIFYQTFLRVSMNSGCDVIFNSEFASVIEFDLTS